MWVHPAAQLHEEDRLHQHYLLPEFGLAGSTSLVVLALNSLSFWFHLKTRLSSTDFYLNLIVVPYATWKKSLPEKFYGGKKVTVQFFCFFDWCYWCCQTDGQKKKTWTVCFTFFTRCLTHRADSLKVASRYSTIITVFLKKVYRYSSGCKMTERSSLLLRKQLAGKLANCCLLQLIFTVLKRHMRAAATFHLAAVRCG